MYAQGVKSFFGKCLVQIKWMIPYLRWTFVGHIYDGDTFIP